MVERGVAPLYFYNISKILSNIQFEQENEEVEDVYKDQKLEKNSQESSTLLSGDFVKHSHQKAQIAAKQFPEEVKKQKAKTKDKKCLLNLYPGHKIPRNTRCDSTGLKYKNCCGKIL